MLPFFPHYTAIQLEIVLRTIFPDHATESGHLRAYIDATTKSSQAVAASRGASTSSRPHQRGDASKNKTVDESHASIKGDDVHGNNGSRVGEESNATIEAPSDAPVARINYTRWIRERVAVARAAERLRTSRPANGGELRTTEGVRDVLARLGYDRMTRIERARLVDHLIAYANSRSFYDVYPFIFTYNHSETESWDRIYQPQVLT